MDCECEDRGSNPVRASQMKRVKRSISHERVELSGYGFQLCVAGNEDYSFRYIQNPHAPKTKTRLKTSVRMKMRFWSNLEKLSETNERQNDARLIECIRVHGME